MEKAEQLNVNTSEKLFVVGSRLQLGVSVIYKPETFTMHCTMLALFTVKIQDNSC